MVFYFICTGVALLGIIYSFLISYESQIIFILVSENFYNYPQLIINTNKIVIIFCRLSAWWKWEAWISRKQYPVIRIHTIVSIWICESHEFWEDAASAPHVYVLVVLLLRQNYFWSPIPPWYNVRWKVSSFQIFLSDWSFALAGLRLRLW